MTFNIGSQSGGVFNNVAGNQYNSGIQQGLSVTYEAARRAVHELRAGVAATRLDEQTARLIRTEVDELGDAVNGSPQPDNYRAARALDRVTRILVAAGALAGAGAALAEPVRTLAAWLGALGEPILRLLPPG